MTTANHTCTHTASIREVFMLVDFSLFSRIFLSIFMVTSASMVFGNALFNLVQQKAFFFQAHIQSHRILSIYCLLLVLLPLFLHSLCPNVSFNIHFVSIEINTAIFFLFRIFVCFHSYNFSILHFSSIQMRI